MKFALCRKGLHELTPGNLRLYPRTGARAGQMSRRCRACDHNTIIVKKYGMTGMLPFGVSLADNVRSANARIGYERKINRDGRWYSSSVTEGKSRENITREKRLGRWCGKKLHLNTPENRVTRGGKEVCRLCYVAGMRARSAERGEQRRLARERKRLRLLMMQAHPDMGGQDNVAAEQAIAAWKQAKSDRREGAGA